MVLLRHLLGDALRRLRQRQGRTLREVSAAARVSLGYLSEVERGQKEASSELLAAHGPVHPDVAAAMAAGARERLGATFGMATTGVAGPDPADGKPPGTVHIAVTAGSLPVTKALALSGGREEVRRDTVEQVLSLLWNVLWEEGP